MLGAGLRAADPGPAGSGTRASVAGPEQVRWPTPIPGDCVSLDDFDRYPLLFGPSPVHRLDRLSEHLGGAQVWAKREDCNSGLAYGGNKTRKLEYIVPD